MNNCPLVSVIIPTYGGAKQLKRAITSVLNQTYQKFELIIVDDNNPETEARKNTEKNVECFTDSRIKYVKHEMNKNGAAARNTGIACATGKYVCFLDDDDFYMPDRIAESVSCLESNLGFDAVLCGVMDCTDSGLYGVRYHFTICGRLKTELLTRKIIMGSGSNIFVTLECLQALGGFDTRFQRLQDDEFMVRFYNKYSACVNDKLLIVKSRNGINNEPALEKLYISRKLFFDKFETDISELSEEDKYLFYNYHYTCLLHAAFYDKGSELKKLVISELLKLRKLTKKEKIQLLLLKYEWGKKLLKLYSTCNVFGIRREKKISNEIKMTFTEDENRYIEAYLGGTL